MRGLARNQRVQGDFQAVVDHVPDHPRSQAACEFQTRVRVYFDQPHLALLVNQEVIPEYFEAQLIFLALQLALHRLYAVDHQHFHLFAHILET